MAPIVVMGIPAAVYRDVRSLVLGDDFDALVAKIENQSSQFSFGNVGPLLEFDEVDGAHTVCDHFDRFHLFANAQHLSDA